MVGRSAIQNYAGFTNKIRAFVEKDTLGYAA